MTDTDGLEALTTAAVGQPRRPAHHRRPGDRDCPARDSAGRGAGRHQRAGPVRARLRDLHPAVPRRRRRGRGARRAAGGRPASRRTSRTSPAWSTCRRTGATDRCSTTPCPASTWRCGTSRASEPACRCTSCSAAGSGRPCPTYAHASGRDIEETLDRPAGTGRARLAAHPAAGRAARRRHLRRTPGRGRLPGRPYPGGWDVDDYLRTTPALFEAGPVAARQRGRAGARRPQPADPQGRRTADAQRSSRTGCSSSRTWSRPTSTTGCPRSGRLTRAARSR